MKWLVCALCCLYLLGLAPRTLAIGSVFGDEGAYALPLDLHRQGMTPYRDYDPPCGPLYFVLAERADRSLLQLRLSAVVAYCLGMVLLTAFVRGPWMVLLAGVVGPQVAGFVPYTDLFCYPLFMVWLLARRPSTSTACAVLLGFLKPQFGVLCLATNWARVVKGPLRFLPWWGGLALLASSCKFPLLLGIVAILAARHIGQTPPEGSLKPHLLGGAVALILVAVTCTAQGIPFYLYPQAMLERATHFRHHIGSSTLWFYPLWAAAPLFLKPRSDRWLYPLIALFALQLARPLPDAPIYALGIVVVLASYPLVLLALLKPSPNALPCLVILGACYDLGYLHARWLPVLFALLMTRWLAAWAVVLFFASVAAFNVPYFRHEYVPLESILVTDDPALELARMGPFEAVDLPGLAFLDGRYTSFQRTHPQYYWLLEQYPPPDTPGTFVVPAWNASYCERLQKCEIPAPPGYRVFR